MNIRVEINRFLVRHEMKPTAFGRDVLGDPGFVKRLDRSEPKARTLAHVRGFMTFFEAELAYEDRCRFLTYSRSGRTDASSTVE